MRKNILALGMILIFAGFLTMAISRSETAKEQTKYELVKEERNFETSIPAITDVYLYEGDKFRVLYSGSSGTVDTEVDVVVYDPLAIGYVFEYGRQLAGVIANETGNYRMEVLGVVRGPAFRLRVEKIVSYLVSTYPNAEIFPIGIAIVAIGAGISVWGTKSQKRQTVKLRRKGALKHTQTRATSWKC